MFELFATVGDFLHLREVFGNIGYVILVFYGICMVPCLMFKNRTACTMIAYLSCLEIIAWSESLWLDPLALMSVNLLLFTALYAVHGLFGSLAGMFGDKVLFLGGCIVVTSALFFALGGYSLFYHSAITIFFLRILWFTGKASYTSLQLQENDGSKGNGSWYPKVEEDIICMPFFR